MPNYIPPKLPEPELPLVILHHRLQGVLRGSDHRAIVNKHRQVTHIQFNVGTEDAGTVCIETGELTYSSPNLGNRSLTFVAKFLKMADLCIEYGRLHNKQLTK